MNRRIIDNYDSALFDFFGIVIQKFDDDFTSYFTFKPVASSRDQLYLLIRIVQTPNDPQHHYTIRQSKDCHRVLEQFAQHYQYRQQTH